MIRIGITGQSGFIGSHLYQFLRLQDGVELVPFEHDFFGDKQLLQNFVKDCDAIVHLAAMNRHPDPEVIYNTNIELVQALIEAMKTLRVVPHIIFSSSTQEANDNLYGKSKKEGREIFTKWAEESKAPFTGIVIPNVFGPFGKPFYNSVIATFCHQLTHEEIPQIKVDRVLDLIYVGELVEEVWKIIKEKKCAHRMAIRATSEIKVSEILVMLEGYRETYFKNHVFPVTRSQFELNLFNTYRSYIEPKKYFPVLLKKNTDNRGSFVESVKTETGGQFSFSSTHPGITRGNHFHTRKVERFIVISGKATIELRKIGTKEKLRFDLDGSQPAFVDMPVWYTHNIINTGDEDLLTLFWINEFYNPDNPDTYFEDV